MTKECPKCGRVLDENEFHWKIRNTRRAVHCKECSRRYIREHYRNNKSYYILKAHKRNVIVKKQIHEYIGNYLSEHPCVDCGEKNIVVLEFDHRNREDKSDEITSFTRRMLSMDRLKKEISKCDVRCSNCHRIKTAKENGSWKLTYAPVA